jgi:hypothetical protein
MIGPFGVMAIFRTCMEAYNNRRVSREPQLSMASTERVESLADTLVDIMPKIVGCEAGDCIITDESSLGDFASDERDLLRFREALRTAYGLDTHSLPDDRLVTIAEAIARGGA